MKIYFERLGLIKKGTLNLNDLTLLCGPNNTGKTYAMYSLYGLLDKNFEVHFDFVPDIVRQLAKKKVYQLNVHDLMAQHFNSNECQTKLSFDQDKDWFLYIEKAPNQTTLSLTLRQANIPAEILTTVISSHLAQLIFSNISHRYFLLPAERASLNLFFKELSSVRNRLLHQVQKDNINPMEVLQDVTKSRYAEPISDYLEFLNNLDVSKKHKSEFYANAQEIQKKILNGKYEVDHEGAIYFLPDRRGSKKIPLHFTSSTVKSFFALVFYLNHLAQKGDCLMIDEPELNLHPDNQRLSARILAQLVNAGLKVIVSTHSSYFVRELNNLILLNKKFSKSVSLKKKYGYAPNDALDIRKVSAYQFDHNQMIPIKLIPDEGILAETFDNAIRSLNQSSHEIYYTIQEELEEQGEIDA